MPCLEENPKVVKPANDVESSTTNNVHEEEEPAVRELTQTDRLNNRLLKSFLDRMNTGGGHIDNFLSNATPPAATNSDDAEEDRSADFEDDD